MYRLTSLTLVDPPTQTEPLALLDGLGCLVVALFLASGLLKQAPAGAFIGRNLKTRRSCLGS
jgi:hypothetical protein